VGEPAPKTYNSYSDLNITITTLSLPTASNHFLQFTTTHCIVRFLNANHSYSCPHLFHVFLGLPLCLASSTFKVISFYYAPRRLHWLPVRQRVVFKVAGLVHGHWMESHLRTSSTTAVYCLTPADAHSG